MKKKVRICLFNPIKCISYPPLNLTFIAGYLLRYGKFKYQIKLVDINFSNDCLKEIIEYNPDIVGFTSLSPFMLEIYDFCFKIRKRKKDIVIVCGGVHATIAPEEVVEHGFDLAVIGEGEKTFTEIVDRFVEASGYFSDGVLSTINGIAFKDSASRIRRTSPRSLIENLDEIPHPARYLLNNEGYRKRYYIIRGMNTYGVYTLHGSRGCPYQCIFCCVNFTVRNKVRLHSPEYIFDEVQILVNTYKARWIYCTDDTFFINKRHTEQLCELLIRRGLNRKVKWEVQIRSNLIKENSLELLLLMKRAGCEQIDFGFESGNSRVLTLIKGKGITLDNHRRAIELVRRAGIRVMGTFILATPTETYKEMLDTVHFIKENYGKLDNFQVGCMTPYPGTRVYQMAVERGIIADDYLALLRKDRDVKAEHGAVVYSDTIPKKDVLRIRMELDNLSLQKVGFFDKAKWLSYNIIHQPKVALNGCRWFLGRMAQLVFSKTYKRT